MSILIGMPCYGGVVSDKTTNSLFNLGKLFVRNNIDHGILTMSNESLISRGRSRIANFFINNTEFEYLFFLDSDVGFEPADVLKLLNHNKELVTGAYPMKTVPLRWNFTLTEPKQIDGSLVAIERIGIGFSLIHRSVFQKIAKKYGEELKYYPTNESTTHNPTNNELVNSYHFFHEMKIDNIYLPEDLSFFTRAKSVGIQSWMDTSINLCHVGSHVFKED
jgi:hypothetical protein